MTLGTGFPDDYLQAQIRRRLKPGVVLKLFRRMDDGRVHEKRFVVVHVDAHTTTCVINSEISPFIRARPSLLRCQVMMQVAQHDFMHHDSHIDCSRVRSFLTDEVIADLMTRPEWILGDASEQCRSDIIAGIKSTETLSVSDVARICDALAGEGAGCGVERKRPTSKEVLSRSPEYPPIWLGLPCPARVISI
ncbi:MAG TPA: hypothetical protein VMF52_02120 [Steroidobacteraceae bacterium]|nr:hypothetical protein [Steroidobacteraceae bacterium]